MYISIMFISYIAAVFVALLGIGIVLLLISKNENRSSGQYRLAMSFAVIVFAQCGLYTFFYYRDMVMGEYSVALPLRITDYILCGLIFFFWLRVMDSLEEHKKSMIRVWSWIVGGIMTASGVIATAFFMDDFYCFNNKTAGMIYSFIELTIAIITLIVTAKYTFDFLKSYVSKTRKRYVLIVSLSLMIWNTQQIFVDSDLYLGIYKSAWVNGVIDTTGIVMFIIGLATFVYLFREDFSPLFYTTIGHDVSEDADILELAAIQHHLTVRELDVLRSVYKGMNNPEIADKLYISINTVKKHLKNIYEKTGTSSRMELVYVINKGETKNTDK